MPTQRPGKVRVNFRTYGDFWLTPAELLQLDTVAAQIGYGPDKKGGRTRVVAAILSAPPPKGKKMNLTQRLREGLFSLSCLGGENEAIAARLSRGEVLIIEDHVTVAMVELSGALYELAESDKPPKVRQRTEGLVGPSEEEEALGRALDSGQADAVRALIPPRHHAVADHLIRAYFRLAELAPYLSPARPGDDDLPY